MSAEGAQLIRAGSNVVYQLVDTTIVRISAAPTSAARGCRAVAVARWLESVDYPAVRAAQVDQPVVLDGRAVTFWRAISADTDIYATTCELAQVLVRLHGLAPPGTLSLPRHAPFKGLARRIGLNGWLSSGDRGFLLGKLTALQEQYADLRFGLPRGVIHGDANVGNVLRDSGANPVVIDLDGFAIGPREWDLALTAIYYDSLGWHTYDEYRTFADAYGHDVMRWAGYPVMRAVREFLMAAWIIERAGEGGGAEAEARHRIETLRTGASRKGWRPY